MITDVLPTGSALGDFEELAALDVANSNSTALGHIEDPGLREAIWKFTACSREPLSVLRFFIPPQAFSATDVIDTGILDSTGLKFDFPTPFPLIWTKVEASSGWQSLGLLRLAIDDNLQRTSATVWCRSHSDLLTTEVSISVGAAADGADDILETVISLVSRLGIPIRDVLAAAGIVKSSYYVWSKMPATRPRLASVGRLWGLAQFAEDLEALKSDPRLWIRTQPERRKMLIEGRFDELLDIAADGPRPQSKASEYGDLYSIGGDAADVESLPPRRRWEGSLSVGTTLVPRGRQG